MKRFNTWGKWKMSNKGWCHKQQCRQMMQQKERNNQYGYMLDTYRHCLLLYIYIATNRMTDLHNMGPWTNINGILKMGNTNETVPCIQSLRSPSAFYFCSAMLTSDWKKGPRTAFLKEPTLNICTAAVDWNTDTNKFAFHFSTLHYITVHYISENLVNSYK